MPNDLTAMPRLLAFRAKLRALPLSQHCLLAAINGAVMSLAMAPLFIWPLMFAVMALMLWQIDAINFTDIQQSDEGEKPTSAPHKSYSLKSSPLKALSLIGWSFGFGYFLVTLYWIGASFLVEAEKFALLMPLAVLVLPALLALFYAVAFLLTRLYWPNTQQRIFTLAITLFAVDWLRGHIFTGFPWQLIGHSLTAPPTLMQSLTLVNLYGLTALAVLIFAGPAACVREQQGAASKTTAQRAGAWAPLLLSLSLLAGLWGYGALRLSASVGNQTTTDVELLLIQPGVSQQDKVRPERRIAATKKVIDLTNSTLVKTESLEGTKTRLIIWPETAILYALNRTKALRQDITKMLQPGDRLITGAYNVTGESPEKMRVTNSLFVLNNQGEITGSYDKHHLVPFGEYLPWPELLNSIGLEALVRMRGGFSYGPAPAPLKLETAPAFIPFICYEIIFPRYVADTKNAGWLLNLSNDGWFGKTAGPHQHAHMARLRSVETGLPLVRLANNGISAIYDGYGLITSILNSDQPGVMQVKLPAEIVKPLTETMKWAILMLVLIISFIILTAGNLLTSQAILSSKTRG